MSRSGNNPILVESVGDDESSVDLRSFGKHEGKIVVADPGDDWQLPLCN